MNSIFRYLPWQWFLSTIFVIVFACSQECFIVQWNKWVTPWLTFDYSWATVVMLGIILVYPTILLIKRWKNYIYDKESIFFLIAFVFVYGYYRITNKDDFAYIANGIAYADLFGVYTGLFLLESIINFYYKQKKCQNELCKLQNDTPILSMSQDSLERSVFVREVSGEICNSDTTHFAQTFGIVAPWGYGKTSFINLMKENLQSNFSKNIETIDYSPWNLPCNISPAEHFFKILAGKFVNSDKDLYHLLKNYAAFMLGNDTNKFLDTIVPSHVHAVSYNDICNALAGYGKKIVVFIDDIDRLEGREILEVFKLMRGSANFPNLIFVVTFDKEYVITALQTVSNAMNENYIKKFFNTEYYLPSYNTNILVELAKEYAVFLSNTDYNNFIKYCTQTEHFWGNTSPIGTLITNIRELKRWINTIRIDYALIKDDVKIEDYADLTLLKIYYHAVYMSIRNEHKTYLIEENGMLVLFNEKAYEHKDDIERKIHCGSKKDFWKNSPAKEFDNIGKEKEKEYLESILSRLFKARMYGAEDRAINNPFCFDRYFYTSIQSDDIADKDFSAFCKSSLSDMKSYVDNNLENKSTALRYKIEQYHTEDSTIATNLLEVIFYAGSKMKGFFIKPDVVYEFLEYTNADIAPRKILIMELMTKNGASHFVKMILSAIDNHRMYVKYRWEELFTEKEKQELKIKMLQFAIEERADIDDVYDFLGIQ